MAGQDRAHFPELSGIAGREYDAARRHWESLLPRLELQAKRGASCRGPRAFNIASSSSRRNAWPSAVP
jgi:hypothetical protein